ncbi:MAG: hypothetical protein EXS30_11675 [Pedosphaera sp.]|nr:hypothetical protein [Pedosphaera sp.]
MAFSVSLSTAGGKTVSVEYATINETATVGSDYAPASGALTFNPGETNKMIFVLVVGDTAVERDEFFLMILANPLNASIGRGQGRGTILNDDSSVSITTQPKDLTISLGGSATVSVTAAGSGALSYQWKFNGTDISGAASPTLSLDNVQPANAGFYTVVVTNSGGAISSAPATLIVLVPPSITQQPQSQTVTLAANVTLSVSVTGSDPLIYQWRFLGDDITGATNSALNLNNVQPTDAGTYTVVVGNSEGFVTSASATLTVLLAPTITQHPQSQNVEADVDVSLSVTAMGSEPLSYQWNFNGNAIAGATSATLVLTNAQPAQAGTYLVVVSNSVGSVTSAAAGLTINSVPEAFPRIDRIEHSGNTINILFTVAATFEFALERIDSLPAGNWTTMTNISAKTGPLSVVVSDSISGGPQLFYRLKVIGRIR